MRGPPLGVEHDRHRRARFHPQHAEPVLRQVGCDGRADLELVALDLVERRGRDGEQASMDLLTRDEVAQQQVGEQPALFDDRVDRVVAELDVSLDRRRIAGRVERVGARANPHVAHAARVLAQKYDVLLLSRVGARRTARRSPPDRALAGAGIEARPHRAVLAVARIGHPPRPLSSAP